MSMGVQMPAKRKAQVILTKEDGSQLVYHTNRRDALHQMLLGVGVLSTDRYAECCTEIVDSNPAHMCHAHLICHSVPCLLPLELMRISDPLSAMKGAIRATDSGAIVACSLRWMWAPNKADAALVQFPTTSLRNNYFLVRTSPIL